jgi:hypothetical protein
MVEEGGSPPSLEQGLCPTPPPPTGDNHSPHPRPGDRRERAMAGHPPPTPCVHTQHTCVNITVVFVLSATSPNRLLSALSDLGVEALGPLPAHRGPLGGTGKVSNVIHGLHLAVDWGGYRREGMRLHTGGHMEGYTDDISGATDIGCIRTGLLSTRPPPPPPREQDGARRAQTQGRCDTHGCPLNTPSLADGRITRTSPTPTPPTPPVHTRGGGEGVHPPNHHPKTPPPDDG